MAHMQEALEALADPSIRHIVPVSGGKDSAALAIYMAQIYPQIPTEYVFCDTDASCPRPTTTWIASKRCSVSPSTGSTPSTT